MPKKGSLSQGYEGAGMLAASITFSELYNMVIGVIRDQKNMWLALRAMGAAFSAQIWQIFTQLGILKTAQTIGSMISTPLLSGLVQGLVVAGASIGSGYISQQIQYTFG